MRGKVLHRDHIHTLRGARRRLRRRPPDNAAPNPPLRASQRYCRDLTRREASNFYWGFVALPRPQRVAIYALYSFARQVDDEVDLQRPATRAADPLRFHRDRLAACFAGRPGDPVMYALAHAVARYGIPRDELEALIRGVEMDLTVSRYESWEDLRAYCRLVASSVGRMCVRVFGYRDPAALDFADDLGVAMQLANTLRDVREDLARGRVYLPQEDLRRFGLSDGALDALDPGPGWEALMQWEIARARRCFDSGLRVADLIPRRAAVCVLTMAGIYQAILEQLADDPYLPLRYRASLGGRRKLAVMLSSWAQAL